MSADKINILLRREHGTSNFTFGSLFINDVFECYTIEDQERAVKIPKETAIPAGVYKLTITPSNRFKRDMPLLLNVPNYEGVRIHTGNTAADTDGCIIVGDVPYRKQGWIGKSHDAFNRLFPKLQQALASGCDITLTIV